MGLVLDVRYMMQDAGCKGQDARSMMQDTGWWEKMNVELARGEQALVRLRRIERPTLNIELKTNNNSAEASKL